MHSFDLYCHSLIWMKNLRQKEVRTSSLLFRRQGCSLIYSFLINGGYRYPVDKSPMHRITQLVSLILIHWIVIYWAIQRLNNWGQLNCRKPYQQLSQLVQFLLFQVAFCLMTVTRKQLDQLQNPVFSKIFWGECVKQKYVLPKVEVEWGKFKPKNPLLGEYIWILTRQMCTLLNDSYNCSCGLT